MHSLGHTVGFDACIILKGYYPTEEKYIPHICTRDELERFLQKLIDAITVSSFQTGIQ